MADRYEIRNDAGPTVPLQSSPPVVPATSDVVEQDLAPVSGRLRAIRTVCTIITAICGLFAIVLGVHIVLVLADANPANGFAKFVDSFAKAVSLGFRGLFTPDSAKLRVLLDDGFAAIVWLIIGAALTYLIRRLTPPVGVRYRRRITTT